MLGLLAAFGASVLYSLGVTLRSIEARLAPEQESLRPALLRRRLVLAGEAMTGGAVAAMATAA